MSTEAAQHPRVTAPVLAAVGSALVATIVVLLGVRGTGHRLVRDFVAVPDPAAPSSLLPSTASQLRAWPLDAVVWAVSTVVPTWLQQLVLLGLPLVLAGVGTGLLVAGWARAAPAPAAVAAAWLAVWNPYVTERLLLGQAPTLLGYACLPWVVLVARSRLPIGRRLLVLVIVALPAALTPWGGVVVAAAAVLADLSRDDRSPARSAVVAGLGVAWCLPWVLPAVVVGGVGADPDGPAAFALADDSGLGTWPSALMGGGVWATGAQPLSRTDPVTITASLALLVLAAGTVAVLVAAALAARRRTQPGSASRSQAAGAIAALLLVGPATVAWWASGPGLDLMATLQQVPGIAILRDQHRMLAPAVLTVAVLVGLAVDRVGRHGGRLAAAGVCGLAVSLAVASVPDLPGDVRTAYRSVTYPAEWDAVVRAVDGDAPRTVLSLPWQPLRRPGWAGEPAFLDPLPRALRAEVLTSTALTVRRDGALVVVDDAPLDEAWASGAVSAESLRRHGVTHVVEWLGTPGALPSGRSGWRRVHSGPDFTVWDVTTAR